MATAFPSRFHVQGNRIVDAAGNQKVFRGLNALDPIMQATGKDAAFAPWSQHYFAEMRKWGPGIVRVPIHPQPWRENERRRLAILDQAIEWIAKRGMYVILDFHSIGFLPSNWYEGRSYVTTEEEIKEFWSTLSGRYADNDVVAFYELFNEPANVGSKDHEGDWQRWKTLCEGLVDVIRANDDHTPIIVGGLHYAYNLSHVLANPVGRPNIVYATHVYPQAPRALWDFHFGNVAKVYPVFCTELGFDSRYPKYAEETLYGAKGRYRRELISYLEERGISWTVWCFAPDWGPGLLKDWDYKSNEAGAFFKEQLLSRKGNH